MDSLETKTRSLLEPAGIDLNGKNPWDPQVKDKRLLARIWSGGSIAAGESYMDGWWEVEDMSGFFTRLLRSHADRKLKNVGALWYIARAYLTNMQTSSRAFEVGEKHYDIGNDLYEKMLGPTMAYTCGYWSAPGNPAKNLDEAQEAKWDLVCRKLGLTSGQTILDVGCGWGGFLKYAAEKYGTRGVGITVSKEQQKLAQDTCKGLPIEIRVEDYRDTVGSFNHVISLGMFEHVGPKNYRVYLEKMRHLLKDDGFFLLHTIGGNHSSYISDAWLDKYIFPNGVIPSIAQIGRAAEGVFVMEDWHNFGVDYDKTLTAWYANFQKAWPELKGKYGERFYRMWRFYLQSCAGVFRARETHLWQIVLSKDGIEGGYQSVR